MRFEIFTEIIAQLRKIGFQGYLNYHFFNEPLLNQNLENLIRHASQRLPGVRHVVFTNGDLLTSARAASLFGSGVDFLMVTDHGGRELTEFLVQLEHKRWIFHPRIWFRRMTHEKPLFNRGGLINVTRPRRFRYCSYVAFELVIDVDGNVNLCCNDYYGSTQFGNVTQTSILNIWLSPAMTNVRRKLLQGEFDLPICRKCVGIAESAEIIPLTRSARDPAAHEIR